MWRLAATLLVVVTLVVDRGARQVRAAGPTFDDDDDDDNRVGLIHSFISLTVTNPVRSTRPPVCVYYLRSAEPRSTGNPPRCSLLGGKDVGQSVSQEAKLIQDTPTRE